MYFIYPEGDMDEVFNVFFLVGHQAYTEVFCVRANVTRQPVALTPATDRLAI